MGRTSYLGTLLLRKVVFAIDTVQQRRHHVFEYSDDPDCILRISHLPCPQDFRCSDGTLIHVGDPIVEIHFANERVPPMGEEGPELGWGLRFCDHFMHSLHLLARFLTEHPEYNDVAAIRGETSTTIERKRYARVIKRLGFDFGQPPCAPPSGRMACFFVNMYVWIIVWVVNPASLRGRSVREAGRVELWMSRRTLMERYLGRTSHP